MNFVILALLFPDKITVPAHILYRNKTASAGTTNHIKDYSINNPVHTHKSHNFVIPYPYQIEFLSLCLPVYFRAVILIPVNMAFNNILQCKI